MSDSLACSVIERPILFSARMVRAILDGSKTQTRRIVKVRNELPPTWATFASEGHSLSQNAHPRPVGSFFWSEEQQSGQPLKSLRRWPTLPKEHPMAGDWYWTPSPYGKIGDRLWVRETWAQPTTLDPGPTFYRADYPRCVPSHYRNVPPADAITWKPSIHMPRALCRMVLEVTGVRVERLQDISYNDARTEGWNPMADDGKNPNPLDPKSWFLDLWTEINGPDSWSANPWVWVIEFKRVDGANGA